MWSVLVDDTPVQADRELIPTAQTGERSMPETFYQDNRHLFQPFTRQEWEAYPFASAEDMKWFNQAKFGLFFHVGISAVGKVDIGWSRHTHKLPDTGEGKIPDEVYDGWADQLSFEAFDAEEWSRMAVNSGAKYVVIIAKHHDGFHMWDTQYSEHKITRSPYGKDYLRQLIDACRDKGLRIGIYYSQRDWYHPDYEPLQRDRFEKAGGHPPYAAPGEKLPVSDRQRRYQKYMRDTVLELMTNYGKIDILWWDALWWGGMFQEEMWDSFALEQEVRRLQPHILINNRCSLPGDFDTPECTLGFYQKDRMWETCMPLASAWAWTGSDAKPLDEIITQLVSCVCGNGNYLLSLGCMGNGAFADSEQQRLTQIGDWLSRYGESLYDTTSGPWLPTEQYGAVFRGDTVYLHLFRGVGQVRLPQPDGNRILSVKCLTGGSVRMETDGQTVKFTAENPDPIDTILVLQMEKKIQ